MDGEPVKAEASALPASELPAREGRFAFAYIRLGNATRAAIEALGIKPENHKDPLYVKASNLGFKLIRRPRVIAFIRAEREKLFASERMSTAEITARLARLGRVDPADFFNEDGSYKSIHEIPPEARFCIAGWEDELRFEEDGAPPTMTRKIKIRDPHPSLRTLAQIEDLLDKGSVQVNLFLDMDQRMDRARKRHEAQRKIDDEERKVVSDQ